ncbi:MAG TPA: enoyl-CoA hydratase-related protein [Anaerolineales bacterium]|nr:enoyl-CoA hydratase-related protein [Anaerolineales bacterium]
MATDDLVLQEMIGAVGLVRLNRPQVLNALNSYLLEALMDTLIELDEDPKVRAIVVTGNERAFAAGADIKEMADASAVEIFLKDHVSHFDRIRQVKVPVIAAVSGYCLGGGCELALSCDMIVASETARFGQPEITIGVIPGAGGTQRLPRVVGKAIAMEMILNNRMLTAQEALHYGLVNRVVPLDVYLQEALDLAAQIAGRAPLAVRLAKEAVNQAYESYLSGGLAAERRAFYFLFSSQDQSEGMAAFLEKRKPNWTGE